MRLNQEGFKPQIEAVLPAVFHHNLTVGQDKLYHGAGYGLMSGTNDGFLYRWEFVFDSVADVHTGLSLLCDVAISMVSNWDFMKGFCDKLRSHLMRTLPDTIENNIHSAWADNDDIMLFVVIAKGPTGLELHLWFASLKMRDIIRKITDDTAVVDNYTSSNLTIQ